MYTSTFKDGERRGRRRSSRVENEITTAADNTITERYSISLRGSGFNFSLKRGGCGLFINADADAAVPPEPGPISVRVEERYILGVTAAVSFLFICLREENLAAGCNDD